MRYFHYGSWQTDPNRHDYDAFRQTKIVHRDYIKTSSGESYHKYGALFEDVDVPIHSVETTLKPGTWGWTPEGADPGYVGKATGLICGRRVGKLYLWYQLGVSHNGVPFAELGWRDNGNAGNKIEDFEGLPITDDTVLKIVPRIGAVEFYVGTERMKTLWWNENAGSSTGVSGLPELKSPYMYNIDHITVQTEVLYRDISASSNESQMELPGTRSDPFVYGPTSYTDRTGSKVEIRGSDFSRNPHNDPNFRYLRIKGNKIKMWSSKNSNKAP